MVALLILSPFTLQKLFHHWGTLKLNVEVRQFWKKVNAAPGIWQHNRCLVWLSMVSVWCRDLAPTPFFSQLSPSHQAAQEGHAPGRGTQFALINSNSCQWERLSVKVLGQFTKALLSVFDETWNLGFSTSVLNTKPWREQEEAQLTLV